MSDPPTTGFPWSRTLDSGTESTESSLPGWSAPLPSPTTPVAVAAATAALLGRYGTATRVPVALRQELEPSAVIPMMFEVTGSETLAELAAQAREASATPTSLSALRDRFGPIEAPGAFPVAVGSGAGSLEELAGTALLVTLSDAEEPVLSVYSDARWLGPDDAADFGRRLARLLQASAADPSVPLGDVDLITDDERARLLGPWAGEDSEYPRDASVIELLHEVATEHPDRIAVEDPRRSLTYAGLLGEALELRERLEERGVPPGGRVGVFMPRSAEAIVVLVAILEHDCAYVPLDIDDPALRLRMLAEDAALSAVIAAPELSRTLRVAFDDGGPAIPVVEMAPGPLERAAAVPEIPTPAGGDRPAYVMYTSGSTGRPKGVEIPHRGIVRLVRNNDFMELEEGERVLGFAPLTFDPSTWEIWTPLLNGGTLVLAPPSLTSLRDLALYVSERRITTANFASALFQEMVEYHLDHLGGVRQLMSGGDVVSVHHAMRVLDRWPGTRVINAYGPTENSFLTTAHTVRPEDGKRGSLPIGRPIRNTTVYILDDRRRLVPPGMVGELYTGGDGLAIGYLDRPELNAERFVSAPFLEGDTERLYRTGDLARHLPDGTIEFLGRLDDQVKIRGFRIEIGEVEAALHSAPGVAMASVVAMGERGDRWLRAGLVLEPDTEPDTRRLAEHLKARLPAFMVPSELLFLEELPRTPRGKPDRGALALLPSSGPASPLGARPGDDRSISELIDRISGVWADLLRGRAFGPDDPFFDVGGDSLLALRLIEELRVRLGVDIPVVRVFEFPTIRMLAEHLADRSETGVQPRAPSKRTHAQGGTSGGVAVIGMAGRFPGADDLEGLWTLLEEEREGIHHFAPEELEVSDDVSSLPNYVPHRGILNDAAGFDAAFFRMTPRLATVTDPQHRLLLESAWQAFEDAGVVPGEGSDLIGAFVGVSQNTYYERNVLSHPELLTEDGPLRLLFGNDKDYVSNLLAQKLDLRGPTATVQSASSTSLTALAMAVQAIRSGSCDLALAGGASVTVPVASGHLHQEGAMFSRDGTTRTFDREASGTVFSDGVAVVLLKRLEDAVRDGDRIQAVIHGVAITNDGAHRASFTAPTVDGQALAVSRALDDAGWSADALSYVEAHGTATPLGDPIEIEALTRAFAETTSRKRFCLIGSLKSNVGHLSAAAGVAGLIKTVLAMQHRWIPRTLHFEAANPAIDFEKSPFVVARMGGPWETGGGPRRAGVSSFGAGGTNVHVVLEEWSETRASEQDETRGLPALLPVSGLGEDALAERVVRLADELSTPRSTLHDVARTLQSGRKPLTHRAFVVAGSLDEAAERLRALTDDPEETTDQAGRTLGTGVQPVFMFAGQGTQFPGMAEGLYETFGAIRRRLDECDRLMGSLEGRSLLSWIFGTDMARDEAADALQRTELAQPALFAVQYAVGGALMEWGVHPRAMIGHSIGEWAAACLAGVMSLESALEAVCERGRLMGAMPTGAMLSVRADPKAIGSLLGPDVVVAAHNAPRLIVVSGPTEAVAALEARLEERDIPHRRLRTSHAFHSSMMDEAAQRFEEFLAGVSLEAPRIPFVACPSGRAITAAEATDPAYWAKQIRDPVRFAEGIADIGAHADTNFIDIGPRATLGPLVRQTLPGHGGVVSLMDASGDDDSNEPEALLRGLGTLWVRGQSLDWSALSEHGAWNRVPLPGYPFQRERFWLEAAAGPGYVSGADAASHRPLAEPPRATIESLAAAQRSIIHRQKVLLEMLEQASHSRNEPSGS